MTWYDPRTWSIPDFVGDDPLSNPRAVIYQDIDVDPAAIQQTINDWPTDKMSWEGGESWNPDPNMVKKKMWKDILADATYQAKEKGNKSALKFTQIYDRNANVAWVKKRQAQGITVLPGISPKVDYLKLDPLYPRDHHEQVKALRQAEKKKALDKMEDDREQEYDDYMEEIQQLNRENTQLALLRNMDRLVATNGLEYLRNRGTTTQKGHRASDDRNTLCYFGNPDPLIAAMARSLDACEFVHALPAELSALVPSLEFFIKDQEGWDTPIIFSDYVSGEQMLKLADARSAGTFYDLLEPTNQMGLNVGIKSFDWSFDNKHEGDKVVKANLVLYFGSLSELVNKYYLDFLFTTGQAQTESEAHNDPAKKATTTEKSRMETAKILSAWEKQLHKGTKEKAVVQPYTQAATENNFRQLFVKVGWAPPDGERLSRYGQPLYGEGFLDSVQKMSKLLLLNMVAYQINFGQDGTVELDIEYVASVDAYYAKSTTDVLAGSGFEDANPGESLQNQEVLLVKNPDSHWIKDYFVTNLEEKVYRDETPSGVVLGYIATQMKNSAGQKKVLESGREVAAFKATQAGVKNEIDFLRLKKEFVEGKSDNKKMKTPSPKSKPPPVKEPSEEVTKLNTALEAAEEIYTKIQEENRQKKYLSFLQTVISRSAIFVATLRLPTSSERAQLEQSKSPKPTLMPTTNRARGQDLGDLYSKARVMASGDGEKVVESAILDPFTRTKQKDDEGYEIHRGYAPIFYMRLADIIDAALVNGDIRREDCNIILSSFIPQLAGLPPPIAGSGTENKYYCLGDLPISFEYFGHWFMQHSVSKERDTWSLRHFLNDVMNGLVGDVLNFVTKDAGNRVYTDFTVVTSARAKPRTKMIDNAQTLKNIFLGTGKEVFESGEVRTKRQRMTSLKLDFTTPTPLHNYFVIFARQLDVRRRNGNRDEDEADGIYHLVLGADRGILKNVSFKEKAMPQYRAMKIENANRASAAAGALVLPQDATLTLVGNPLFQNGQLVYVNAELGLGKSAANALRLGGYYRIYRVDSTIGVGSYETVLECMYDDPRKNHVPT